MSELSFRPAEERDLPALHRGLSEAVAEGTSYPQDPAAPFTMDDFVAYWIEGKSAVVVAERAGTIVGSYYVKPNFPGRGAHIANAGYFVVAAERGRGIGTALVQHSMEEARRLGFDALQFNLVFEHNPARRLYERLGFEAVGRIPDAIAGEAAIVYWRRL